MSNPAPSPPSPVLSLSKHGLVDRVPFDKLRAGENVRPASMGQLTG